MYNGVSVTTPARAIIDAAAAGTDPSRIHKALRDARDRGRLIPESLRAANMRHANQYQRNVRQLIEEVLSDAAG